MKTHLAAKQQHSPDVSARSRGTAKASLAGDESSRQTLQRKQIEQLQAGAKAAERGGLPAALTAAISQLSGVDLSGVKVIRNSAKPAQLNAHAFAQGGQIHLAPGQERHLAHEAWHLVQQRQGRVRATLELEGATINDDAGLERDADRMSAQALRLGSKPVDSIGSAGETAAIAPQLPARSDAAAQCVRIDSELPAVKMGSPPDARSFLGGKSSGDYLREHRQFLLQSRSQMEAFREQQARSEEDELTKYVPPEEERELKPGQDIFNVPESILAENGRHMTDSPFRQPVRDGDKPAANLTSPKRLAVLEKIARAQALRPTPRVGISNRAARGFINDSQVFKQARPAMASASLPPRFQPLEWTDPKEVMDKQGQAIRSKRSQGELHTHFDHISGLFIPGGQDREKEGSDEQISREAYEMRLIHQARQLGLPTMAVCGGSRALARGFGGQEELLSNAEKKTHKQKNQETMGHPILLRSPHDKTPLAGRAGLRKDEHSLVGGAAPRKDLENQTDISAVNSTHEKIVAHRAGEIEPVDQLPATGEAELMSSAWSPEGYPEAFETRYGAPIFGITSHPEAMHSDKATRNNTPSDAQEWSDNLFKGFAQSMQAYEGKQAVNAEIRAPGIAAARAAQPKTYAKWAGKRNWQKLKQLGMIDEREAAEMRDKVQASKQRKYQRFLER